MAANMYRVGDYVYFETSSTTPYQIRRIEELNKTPNGNVEAKVMCFYRRRDISSSLITLADKHQGALEEERDEEAKEELDDKNRHQLKHRELFLSRQVETLPATHIRGKCAVTLLNETEALQSYLSKEDAFFYSLVYDPQQKTLLADKGEIRVGSKFQAEVQRNFNKKDAEEDTRKLEDLEELIWCPTNSLTDRQIDQFMVIARSVGTFARALDCTSTVRQPSLHMSAAAASRDVTLYHAMDILHKHRYDVSKAISSLVPPGGPVLCRDEMEEWSASEANLFEEALDKYGKDFNDIRQDFLPWKSLKSIVEYYYMWKTTDRYVQQKRIKAAEAETKLKQVYIPNYNKANPAQITGKMNGADGAPGRACESCYTAHSHQWYSWGPVHMACRLCATCWTYWKKNGGLKMPTRLGGYSGDREAEDWQGTEQYQRIAQMAAMRMHRCTISGCGKEFKLKAHLARHLATAHGLAIRAGSPRPVMKTRAAFCLITTPLTRICRQVCRHILRIKHAARQPFQPINSAAIKQEFFLPTGAMRMPEAAKHLKPLHAKKRKPMDGVVSRMGIDIKQERPALLLRNHTPKEPLKQAFPRPAVMPMPTKSLAESNVSPGQPSIMKKRGYEQANGLDGPSAKRPAMGVIRQVGPRQPTQMVRDTVINHLNGRGGKVAIGGGRGRKQILSWVDAPDDVYFFATDATRKLRKQMNSQDFRRAARKPWRRLNVKTPASLSEKPPTEQPPIVILD